MADEHPLTPYGWSDRVAALTHDFTQPGRVVRVEYGSGQVMTVAGERTAWWTGTTSRQAGVEESPAVGDWVDVVEEGDGSFAVGGLAERWSTLRRGDASDRHTEQVLAANVDLIFVVAAIDNELNSRRLDRLLAVAWDSGARPILVLTKPDLAPDVAETTAQAERLADTVLLANGTTGEGVDELRRLLAGQTGVFLGPSGVGKSTLVNALAGETVMATAEVRDKDGKGRHTTTTREMFPVPSGGVIIDTPGIRGVQLWGATEGVAAQFEALADQVAELAAECRFRNCQHEAEPGCAVRAAVESGELDAERLADWRHLEREVAAWELRQDEHARRTAARKFTKAVRKLPNR